MIGLALRANLPGVRVGQVVEIVRREAEPILAEVTGFSGAEAVLVPLSHPENIGPEDLVRPRNEVLSIKCSTSMLGRIFDGLGRPIDGLEAVKSDERWSVMRPPPSALSRMPVEQPLSLGIRAIDSLNTVGLGQRVGVFAGPGVGKSVLLGQIARGTDADVVVVALIGERGREVREFIGGALGSDGLKRAVVVCATSDEPAIVRLKAAFVATAVAEFFRERGQKTLLLLDSITRVARAQREVGLTSGEPPVRRGYPPSVFAMLPRLLERAGNSAKGSMTAVYTVLVEGGDLDEPIAEEVRAILDGHIVLSPELAQRGQFPAIDVPASLSRLMDRLVSKEQRVAAAKIRRLCAILDSKRHIIELGAHRPGVDRELDEAVQGAPSIRRFLEQDQQESVTKESSSEQLIELARRL